MWGLDFFPDAIVKNKNHRYWKVFGASLLSFKSRKSIDTIIYVLIYDTKANRPSHFELTLVDFSILSDSLQSTISTYILLYSGKELIDNNCLLPQVVQFD